jgi:predicted MPP superfamily phosphohydrolase
VALGAAYARCIEPRWLCVRRVTLASPPTVRLIHISDIHFAGDARYLRRVVAVINATEADLVCFTGDLIEDAAFAGDALRLLATINKPLYGVPGNHDQWALRSFDGVGAAFRKTGGNWLTNTPVLLPGKRIALLTLAALSEPTPPGYRRILLEHYPEAVDTLRGVRFALILAGHTHGGQVRIPLVNRFVMPFDVGRYDKGLFQTPYGPLYVNPGIGTFYGNVRFLCRPEITVIEL